MMTRSMSASYQRECMTRTLVPSVSAAATPFGPTVTGTRAGVGRREPSRRRPTARTPTTGDRPRVPGATDRVYRERPTARTGLPADRAAVRARLGPGHVAGPLAGAPDRLPVTEERRPRRIDQVVAAFPQPGPHRLGELRLHVQPPAGVPVPA